MECSICCCRMTGEKPDFVITTTCGHLYHEKCVKDYVTTTAARNVQLPPNQRVIPTCPLCKQTKLTEGNTIRVHLSLENNAVNEQLLMTRIADIHIAMEKREKNNAEMTQQLTDSMKVIAESMNTFEFQNDMLRKENAELKSVSDGTTKNDPGAMKEQMKAKDYMIANLQKEVNDLKTKRAETTREMNLIREQINLLKSAAKGEKRGPTIEQPRHQSLTLKFDDFSDKLIIE